MDHFNIKQDFALLLTATVQPNQSNSNWRVTVSDPRQRETDYITGLTYYLREQPSIQRIVFVENSNWDLSSIQNAVSQIATDAQLELISLDCNQDPVGFPFTLGYGESVLIKKAFEKSQILNNTKYFGKITGRLRLLNMVEILQRVPRPFEMYCDLLSHYVPLKFDNSSKNLLKFHWEWHHYFGCDTRFCVLKPGFYVSHLRDLHEKHVGPEPYIIEHAWYHAAMRLRKTLAVIPRFPLQPRFSGFSGSQGYSYDSRKELMKRTIRQMNRRLFPWMWL